MIQKGPSSLAFRAFLAVVLMVGFYVLALGIAAALFALVYFQVAGGLFSLYLIIICLFGGFVILWSILPRIDRFLPPGPQLKPEEHPRLFAELKDVADKSGQKMPAEVYLLPDVNAWVAQRKGFLGIGSQRIMGIGLPLLKVLTVSQFRAVMAHEFGHYYRGDTALGPWIYRTRSSIIRTLIGLRGNSMLQLPFRGYTWVYLRITQSISRRQEYLADEQAAKIEGSLNMQKALRSIHGSVPAWQAYWSEEISPVVSTGLLPPLSSGFGRFLQSKAVAEKVNQIVDLEIKSSKTNPFDSHPSIKDRLSALSQLPSGEDVPDEPPAISLIGDISSMETELLNLIAKQNRLAKLTPVAWEDLTEKYFIPTWKKLVERQKNALKGLAPDSLPEVAHNLSKFIFKLVNVENLDEQQRESYAAFVVGAALSLALVKQGWSVIAIPGEDITLIRNETTWFPFHSLTRLAAGSLTREQWTVACSQAGITGMDLAQLSAD